MSEHQSRMTKHRCNKMKKKKNSKRRTKITQFFVEEKRKKMAKDLLPLSPVITFTISNQRSKEKIKRIKKKLFGVPKDKNLLREPRCCQSHELTLFFPGHGTPCCM